MAEEKDFYKVLGVDRNATDKEIKSAYHKLAMQYHPDRNPGDKAAEEKMKEINEAYSVLSDPDKKAKYDKFGMAGIDPNFGAGGFGGGAGGFGDFGDIFGDIFGSAFGGGFGGFGGQSSRRNGPRKGADIQKQMNISFDEAVFGCKKTIKLTKDVKCDDCDGTGAEKGTSKTTCPDCGGSGQVRTVKRTPLGSFQSVSTCPRCGGTGTIIEHPCHTCSGSGKVRKTIQIEVNIPAGVDTDTVIPIRGQGQPGTNGGPAGDLYIVLNVAEDPVFKRDGDDVYVDVPVSVAQAALGDDITFKGLKENLTWKIPAGTQPGEVFRLRGKGIINPRTQRMGDMYITVKVQIPTKLTNEQKELIRQAFGNDSGKKRKK